MRSCLLYRRLVKSLLLGVAGGALTVGHRFPSQRRVERMWGVSRPTVERAVRFLSEEGVIERQGPRSWVQAGKAPEVARRLLKSLPFPELPLVAEGRIGASGTALAEGTLAGAVGDGGTGSEWPAGLGAPVGVFGHFPLEEHLLKSLLIELAGGMREEGECFLSGREIERMWKVSRATAGRALDSLARIGLLEKREKRRFLLQPSCIRKARLFLARLPLPALPPPSTWQGRRRRILGRDRPEGYRLAAIFDELSLDWRKLSEIGGGWTFEDTRTKVNNQWYLLSFLHEANRHFCEVEFLHDDRSETARERILSAMDAGRFDGVAVFQKVRFFPRKQLLGELKRRGLPVVTVLDSCEGEADASVEFNDSAAGFDAMKILLDHGHRDIFYLFSPKEEAGKSTTFEGAMECVRQMGLQREVRIRSHRWRVKAPLARKVRTIFSRKDGRPTAVFSAVIGHFDKMSWILKELGIRIPRDLSVIGCGAAYTHSEEYGPLDVLEKNLALLGQKAAEQLVALIEGRPVERTLQLTAPHLDRGSVAAPRAKR